MDAFWKRLFAASIVTLGACTGQPVAGRVRVEPKGLPPPSLDAGAALEASDVPRAPDASTAGAATLFENTRWGMTREELMRLYGGELTAGTVERFPGGRPPILVRRVVQGLEVEVAFHVGKDGLEMIEFNSQRKFEDVDACRINANALEEWVAARAGEPTERSSFGTHWRLPDVHIEVYCEEGVGGYYEPASKAK